MKQSTKTAIVIALGLATAALSYYFLIYKPANPKADKQGNMPGDLPGGTQTPTDNNNTGILNQGPVSVVGKKMYAIKNDVKVVSVNTGETVRIKQNGEFVGIIDGEKKLGGSMFYTTAGGAWAVGKTLVRVS